MRIFVAGATGVIGRRVVRDLLGAGHDVSALTRSAVSAERLRARGVHAYVGDALDAPRVREVMTAARPETVVHLLTSIPARVRPRHMDEDMAATNRLRRAGTAYLLWAAASAGARRVVAQSIAFAYDRIAPGGVATETSPLLRDAGDATETLAAVAAMEGACLHAPLSASVLRLGVLHGQGTVFDRRDGTTVADLRRGRLPIGGSGHGRAPFVHVDDAARAFVRAVETRAAGVFNVVEDDCPRASEWIPRLATSVGGPPPRQIPLWIMRLAAGRFAAHAMARAPDVSNLRARATLGWEPTRAWSDEPVLDTRAPTLAGGVRLSESWLAIGA